MTIPLRLGILNNNDDQGNTYKIKACGFSYGGKWNPLLPAYMLKPGLETPYVGYWSLGEESDSTAYDISENALTMDYIGNPDLGNINAPHFDGLTTYLRGENIAMYDSTDEISVAVTYKVDEPIPYNPDAALVSKWSTGNESWGVFLSGNGTLSFEINGDQIASSLDQFFEDGITYKVIFTYDGTTVKLYVNDKEQSLVSSMSGPINKTTAHINIGRTEDGTKFFHGWIREVVIYRYAITKEEVIALPLINIGGTYESLPPGAKAYRDAVAALPFDKMNFGLDASDPGVSNGGVSGTIAWNNLNSFASQAVAAQAAILIPEDKTYGRIASNSFMDTLTHDDYTINMWCKMSSWPSENYTGTVDKKATLLVRYNSDSIPGYMITIFAPGVYGSTAKIKFITSADAGRVEIYSSLPSDIAINEWFMVSCVVDNTAGTSNIYLNGVLSTLVEGTFAAGTLAAETYEATAVLGARSPSNPDIPELFDGYMDEVSLIAGVVSAPDLLNLYDTGNHYG